MNLGKRTKKTELQNILLGLQKNINANNDSIIFGDLNSGSSALLYIAQDQHFFGSNGINLTIEKYSTGLGIINATINGKLDFGVSAEFAFVANSALKKENVSIIATWDKFDTYSMIAKKDSGINNVTDLVGKKVGVSIGTAAQFYLGRFLSLNGLSPNNLTIVNIPPEQSVSAITNGTVDADAVFSPYSDQIQAQLGNNMIVWQVQSNQEGYGVIFCRDSLITQHPDLVVRFLKSLNQAEDFLVNNPSGAKAIYQKQFNLTDNQVTEVWTQHRFSLSLDQSLILAMEDEARWQIDANFGSTMTLPNFLDYVYLNGLRSVKPEAVNIIG